MNLMVSQVKSMIANYISEDNRFQELDEVFGQENILVTDYPRQRRQQLLLKNI